MTIYLACLLTWLCINLVLGWISSVEIYNDWLDGKYPSEYQTKDTPKNRLKKRSLFFWILFPVIHIIDYVTDEKHYK